jgi:hypothetical protein
MPASRGRPVGGLFPLLDLRAARRAVNDPGGRSHPQWHQSGRPPGAAADEIHVCYQPQDRQGARPHHPGNGVGQSRCAGPTAPALRLLGPVRRPGDFYVSVQRGWVGFFARLLPQAYQRVVAVPQAADELPSPQKKPCVPVGVTAGIDNHGGRRTPDISNTGEATWQTNRFDAGKTTH